MGEREKAGGGGKERTGGGRLKGKELEIIHDVTAVAAVAVAVVKSRSDCVMRMKY